MAITTEQWIQKARKKHGDRYDYSRIVYKGAIQNVIVGCFIHGWIEIEARGHIKTMGCQKCSKLLGNKKKETHGKSYSTEYKIWKAMKYRCTDPNNINYMHYGGRGITVCSRWLESFENFYADMGPRPADTTIDRIDNNAGYSSDNCRWATRIIQQNNRSTFNHRIQYAGMNMTSAEWANVIGIDRHAPARWNNEGRLEKMYEKHNVMQILQKIEYI